MKTNCERTAFKILQKIMQRYDRYGKFLSYPGDWGERAFRGWLVFDLFHGYLGWPINKIVFGEKFDVLLINDDIKPVINIETKKPGKDLSDYDDFIDRLSHYQTLFHAILTDGHEWLCHNCLDGTEFTFKLVQGEAEFERFIKPFFSKRYLYGDEN